MAHISGYTVIGTYVTMSMIYLLVINQLSDFFIMGFILYIMILLTLTTELKTDKLVLELSGGEETYHGAHYEKNKRHEGTR